MAIFSTAGASFFVGPANNTANTISAYELLTYVEVGEIGDLGEFGDESNPVTFTSLADGRVKKKKGSRDAGTITLQVALDRSDTGQLALQAAEKSPNDFAFYAEFNDMPAGGVQNTKEYFRGQVMSFKRSVGSADNIIMATINIGINSEIITDVAV